MLLLLLVVDGGGKLGGNRELDDLFEKAGCTLQPTAPDSSSSNGPGERPHRFIGEALCAILPGAGLAKCRSETKMN